MTMIAPERPRGHEVRAWRERAGYVDPDGRSQLAALLHCTESQLKNWENEKRGVLMPADTWLLMRITLDPLAREEWIKSRRRREQHAR